MCKIEPEIAQKMVLGLSGLLRYSMDGGLAEVTLKEDLDHLENYLTILHYRFNRRFSYRIDVEPEAFGCRIPKLVVTLPAHREEEMTDEPESDAGTDRRR